MIKHPLTCFYTISHFKHHAELKSAVLDAIALADAEHVVAPSAEVDISKGDWFQATNTNRPWTQIILPKLMEHTSEIYRQVGYDMFHLREFWFQQYNYNSGHGWHIHSANFTNVYYLDLPDGTPKTQMISPFDQKTISEFDIKEGDILTFPSFVLHRAPPNLSSRQKTIISYNIDIDYPDSQYGKNLKD